MKKYLLLTLALILSGFSINTYGQSNKKQPEVDLKKIKDLVIYEDSLFYSSFPSIIKTKDNKFLLSFRRAPERRAFGESSTNHVDPNSYLVQMTSKDGKSWTKSPKLLYAHPFGGSQDPCLLTLRNGEIICASYGWSFLREEGLKKLTKPSFYSSGATFLGGYLVKSYDHGKTWSDAIYPMAIDQEVNYDMYGKKVPVYNRGALVEGKNGWIYWVVAATTDVKTKRTSNYLMVSKDKGLTWNYSAVVADDPKISFNETSIYETPKGDLVAFLRTANFADQACIARSTDGGKTFTWESMGFKGHPMQALRLPDNRVLITYGYRHKPYGIRARILNEDCTDFKTAKEFVIREDGGSGDIGYPWSVMLNKNQVLVVYYYNKNNGIRHIAGSILEIVK